MGRGIAAALLLNFWLQIMRSQSIAAITHQILFCVQVGSALHQLLLQHRRQGVEILFCFLIHTAELRHGNPSLKLVLILVGSPKQRDFIHTKKSYEKGNHYGTTLSTLPF